MPTPRCLNCTPPGLNCARRPRRAEIGFEFFVSSVQSKRGGGVSCVPGVRSVRSLGMNMHEGVEIHSKVQDLRSVAAALLKLSNILMKKSAVSVVAPRSRKIYG